MSCWPGWKEHDQPERRMVDRITPRPAPDVAERVLAATGKVDKAAVMGGLPCGG